MSANEMREYLAEIQKELPQTKILNSILACFQEIDQIKKVLIETQEKVNEIIDGLYTLDESAEALSSEIQEDKEEQALTE